MKANEASVKLNLARHLQPDLWPDFHNGNLNLDLLPNVVSWTPHLPKLYCYVTNLELLPFS